MQCKTASSPIATMQDSVHSNWKRCKTASSPIETDTRQLLPNQTILDRQYESIIKEVSHIGGYLCIIQQEIHLFAGLTQGKCIFESKHFFNKGPSTGGTYRAVQASQGGGFPRLPVLLRPELLLDSTEVVVAAGHNTMR